MIQPRIVIVDYDVGNTHSVWNAVKTLGYSHVKISSLEEDILKSDALILPGVGAFDACMSNLVSRNLDEILHEAVQMRTKPILGICVGMQLFSTSSEENGEHFGLNWIPGKVIRLKPSNNFRVPHVGWNSLEKCKATEIFSKLPINPHFYFDHSFHYDCDENFIDARCDYGGWITAAISKNNIHGVQFHPEKSQKNGLKLFRSFFNWVAKC
jgi:glutamine amidotransferase